MTKPIHTCLWFDGNAKEAADYYCTTFKNSKIISANPMTIMFEMNGMLFMGLNGGPQFKFNESVSFVITCKDQVEIDYYWDTLTANGGQESRCGWLKDKFGLSWQVVPEELGEIFSNPTNGQRALQAMLKMNKLNIAVLKNA
jgi:predicted 3-demethylubiquinone-9 3-methyltransferase (glyoxalase superfamily)